MLWRPSESRISVAEMDERRDPDALQATVQGLRPVVAQLVVVARHRRLIDLDHVAAGGLDLEQFLIQCDGDIERQLGLILVALVEGAIDHRHWARYLHFQRTVGVGPREASVFDSSRRPARDLSDDTRYHLIHDAIAVTLLVDEIRRVHPVPLTRDVEDETFPALFAVGHQIEAELFLVTQYDDRCVVARLLHVLRRHDKSSTRDVSFREPFRSGKAADAGCRQRWKLHVTISVFSDALCRPVGTAVYCPRSSLAAMMILSTPGRR